MRNANPPVIDDEDACVWTRLSVLLTLLHIAEDALLRDPT